MHSGQSHLSVGLPHSEIRGSQPSYRLLSAYRRFSRPSSPLNAKASITCPFSLGHAYLTPCGAGHATSGLCGSGQSNVRRTAHARRRPKQSRDRSRCFNSLAPPVAAFRGKSSPRRTTCLARTTNTSLVKEPESAVADGGSEMVLSCPLPSRGWRRCPAVFLQDVLIGELCLLSGQKQAGREQVVHGPHGKNV